MLIGKKSLGETMTTFALAGFLESLIVVLIDSEGDFSGAGKNIPLSVMEFLP